MKDRRRRPTKLRVTMNLFKNTTLQLALLSFILGACSAGTNPGTTITVKREVDTGDGKVKDNPTHDSDKTPDKEYEGDKDKDKSEDAEGKTPVVDRPVTPTPGTTPPDNSGEIVLPPSDITGAYLFCFRDRVESNKATVFCATEDEKTKKIIKANERYANYDFKADSTQQVKVAKRDLPVVHRYQVEYTLTADNADLLTANMNAIKYVFTGVDFDNKIYTTEARVTTPTRPEIWVQSLKPQANAGFRCLDRDRMKAAQPFQIVTTPCGSNSMKHDWFVTKDNKISHVGGECLAFDPTDGLTVVKACNSAESPRFEFNGEQIKIANSSNCLGLKNADNSGVDYSAAVPCNTGDAQQRWKVSPQALP